MLSEQKRKFTGKRELLFLILLAIIFALVIFLFPMKKTGDIIATVYYQSEKYTEINLTQTVDGEIIEVFGDLPVVLEVREHGIAFIHAQCPDKICEQYGYIDAPGEQAICLPARVSVIISGSGSGLDMISE